MWSARWGTAFGFVLGVCVGLSIGAGVAPSRRGSASAARHPFAEGALGRGAEARTVEESPQAPAFVFCAAWAAGALGGVCWWLSLREARRLGSRRGAWVRPGFPSPETASARVVEVARIKAPALPAPDDTPVLPRLFIAREVLRSAASGMLEFHWRHPGLETGYALIGAHESRGSRPGIVVRGLIEAGPRARHEACEVEFDRAYQQLVLDLLLRECEIVGHVGDLHSHPGGLDRCSDGDFQTDLNSVKESKSGFMVFGIATERSGWPERSGAGLRCGPYMLNFFYLGPFGGYRYVRMLPELTEGGCLRAPEAWRSWIARDPDRATHNLRGLVYGFPGYGMRIEMLPGSEGRGVLVALTHARSRRRVVLLTRDPSTVPEISVELPGGEWLDCSAVCRGAGWFEGYWDMEELREVVEQVTAIGQLPLGGEVVSLDAVEWTEEGGVGCRKVTSRSRRSGRGNWRLC